MLILTGSPGGVVGVSSGLFRANILPRVEGRVITWFDPKKGGKRGAT